MFYKSTIYYLRHCKSIRVHKRSTLALSSGLRDLSVTALMDEALLPELRVRKNLRLSQK